jgi:hypothetical protein
MSRSQSFLMLCLLVCAAGAPAAELGRLFFTPAQRAALDGARKQNIRAEVGNDSEQPAAPVPQHVSVSGLVQRSDGKSTVWVNSRALTEQQQAGGGFIVTPDRKEQRVKLTVPESGRSVDLKVGQTVEVLSGTVAEGYSRGAPLKAADKPAPAPENKASRGEVAGPKAPLRRDEAAAQVNAQPDAGAAPAQ